MIESKDILVLFEQLSNYEVFTPPRITNDMLNLLPQEVFTNPDYKFLDPCVKSGVFLREIFFRLMDSLPKDESVKEYKASDGLIYDLTDGRQRASHIFKNMLYGVAISELTGYLSRRTLYGVMRANTDKQQVVLSEKMKAKMTDKQIEAFIESNAFNEFYDHNTFNTEEYKGFEEEGNIFYPTQEVLELIQEGEDIEIEDKYIPFIDERTKHKKILDIKENKMKFDVIIGNPPYQISDGGAQASAMPVYQIFINKAIELNPKYISMITPSRWFTGGKGLDLFRKTMLKDTRLEIMHDFLNAKDCFPGVEIKGGVNYFLWSKNYSGPCNITTHVGNETNSTLRLLLEKETDIFIRDNKSIPILRKVKALNEGLLSQVVSRQKPFGLRTFFVGEDKEFKNSVKVYRNKGVGYIERDIIEINVDLISKHKVILPRAIGSGESSKDIFKPLYSEPNSCCSETYVVIGAFDSEREAKNMISYIHTKFFHYLVGLKKNTMMAPRSVYEFVPIQSFFKKWTDEELYSKYHFTEDEILHIENNIPDSARG